jgi:hypothetical protein
MYETIIISTVNSTYYELPQLYIAIKGIYGALHKNYTITTNEPKIIIDLTAELAAVKPNEEIVSAYFVTPDDKDQFYKDCVNILNNIFISYTYL